MKLAVLKGNRFNPWHLCAFNCLRGDPGVTAFRAESEIQRVFCERDDSAFPFDLEPIYFDTDTGSIFERFRNRLSTRFFDRESRIVPFHDRLAGYDLVQSWELFTDWTAEAIVAREKYGVPLALMIWDNIPFNMERNPKRRKMKEHAAAVADRFLVHTERSRRTLDMEGVPEDRIVQMKDGLIVGDTTVDERRREQILRLSRASHEEMFRTGSELPVVPSGSEMVESHRGHRDQREFWVCTEG
ncbi:MAG: hypothetical protein IIB38_16015 [Candidatus Hydrogenedentes bacterium]|nr:hypothetical protein [Candidatus Hydrogenedentota bacterium]